MDIVGCASQALVGTVCITVKELCEEADSGEQDEADDREDSEGGYIFNIGSSPSRSTVRDAFSRGASRLEFASDSMERSLVWWEIHLPTWALTKRCIFNRSLSEDGRALTK